MEFKSTINHQLSSIIINYHRMELHFVYRELWGKHSSVDRKPIGWSMVKFPKITKTATELKNWSYPTCFLGLCFRAKFHREWPEKIWPKIWYRCTNVPPCIGSWNSHWLGKPMEFDHFFCGPSTGAIQQIFHEVQTRRARQGRSSSTTFDG